MDNFKASLIHRLLSLSNRSSYSKPYNKNTFAYDNDACFSTPPPQRFVESIRKRAVCFYEEVPRGRGLALQVEVTVCRSPVIHQAPM